jgi:hypothetical protein
MGYPYQTIACGAFENAHLTYYLFKIWTSMYNILTFDKLDQGCSDARPPARPDRPPVTPDRPSRPPNKEIFKYI